MWELGWNASDLYLAAELVLSPGVYLGAIHTPNGEWLCDVVYLGGILGWQVANVQAPPVGHPHFPFGALVHAD